MYCWRILLFSVLFFSFAFALDFSLKTNVDAEVSFKNGSSEYKVTTVGGQEQSVSIDWINSQMEVEISAKPKNNRYKSENFTRQMGFNASNYPAWEKKAYTTGQKVSHNGQDWEAKWWTTSEPGVVQGDGHHWKVIGGEETPPVIIDFVPQYSNDTAFIPIYSNRPCKIDVSSAIAKGTVEIEGKKNYLLMLPLFGSGITIDQRNLDGNIGSGGTTSISNGNSIPASKKAAPAKLVARHGHYLLSLSQNDYKNAEIRLLGINGRVISNNKLSGVNQTSITVSNVSTGIYILNVKGINGANFTSKIMHNGGDLRFAASFSNNFEIGGLMNSRTISVAEERTTKLRAGDIKYTLTYRNETLGTLPSVTIDCVGGKVMNEQKQEIYFNDPNALPSEKFEDLLSKEQYERIFPNRYGFGRQECANATANADENCSQGKSPTGNDGDYDYYSYESLLKAIDLMGEIEVDYDFGKWSGLFRMTWKNKKTGIVKTIIHPKFEEYGGASESVHIDYADYCNSGDMNTRKQEIAASLAHMTQETSGYGTSGDVHFHWGLYWREEAGNPGPYASVDPLGYYNPVQGKSYHGRGPKQLTHPYNYGPFSEFLYGDKDVLLNNPDLLCPPKPNDATVAFASAIWFWMTPQPPKPSSHDVMTGNVDSKYITGDRAKSKFGWTISIINGGYECVSPNDARANNRIQHYKRYMQILGTSDETADYGCYNMN